MKSCVLMHMIHCSVGVDLIGLDPVNSCVFMRVLHCSEEDRSNWPGPSIEQLCINARIQGYVYRSSSSVLPSFIIFYLSS